MTDKVIGLLGGGQLGQMLCEAAGPLGITVKILDVGNSPAKMVNNRNVEHLDGKFTDPEKIRELARHSDIITVEIEHVDTTVLEEIAEKGVEVEVDRKKQTKRVEIQPSWRTLRTIQDKYLQKEHLTHHGVAVAESVAVESTEDSLLEVGKRFGFPYMLKSRKDAYDGRGNFPIKDASKVLEALQFLKDRSLYAEKWAQFKMELAVMVVKTSDDTGNASSTIAYPAVQTIHEDSICKLVWAPARGVSSSVLAKAQTLARHAVASLWGKGVFGVEMFLMPDDVLVVNEIAPRPHNSGHYTIEACPTMSQYKSQLLSILGIMPTFPNNTIPMAYPSAVMLNILGGSKPESHKSMMTGSIVLPGAALHMYSKASKPARKIGHITIVSQSLEESTRNVTPLIDIADSMRAERFDLPAPKPSDLTTSKPQSLVAVRSGSDSDLKTLEAGLLMLEKFGVPHDWSITSAHRTPELMVDFAKTAADKGYKVIIACAGGAAHLPGMIASETTLPVIGVPVASSVQGGLDSLLSINQMPRGIPVATQGIGNSTNAALLAIRILALSDPDLKKRYEEYVEGMKEEVYAKNENIEKNGWKGHLKTMEGVKR